VLNSEYEKLRANVEAGEQSVIDDYGATNPAEFFAVATESFFERPHEMQRRHPALNEELRKFYRQDPVGWLLLSIRGKPVTIGRPVENQVLLR